MDRACSRVALGDLGRPAGCRSLTPKTLGALPSFIKAQLLSTSGSGARWAQGARAPKRPLPAPVPPGCREKEPGAGRAGQPGGAALGEVWAPRLEEEARARAGRGRRRRSRSRSRSRNKNKNRSRGQSTESPGRLQAPRTPLNGEGGGRDEKVSRGATRAVAAEDNSRVGAPRCFRSCLGCKRKILERMVLSGLPVANTRGQRCPCYKPGLWVWWCGRGSRVQSPLLGTVQEEKGPGGPRKGRSYLYSSSVASLGWGERKYSRWQVWTSQLCGSSRQIPWKWITHLSLRGKLQSTFTGCFKGLDEKKRVGKK